MLDPEQFEARAQEYAVQPVLFGPGLNKNTDFKNWVCLYPNYIDSKKTRHEGRKIPIDKAVSAPHIRDMAEAAVLLGVPFVVEDKAYSRDFLIRGRIRLLVFQGDSDHKIVNPALPSRKAVMYKMAEIMSNRRLEMVSAEVQGQQSTSSVKQKKKKK